MPCKATYNKAINTFVIIAQNVAFILMRPIKRIGKFFLLFPTIVEKSSKQIEIYSILTAATNSKRKKLSIKIIPKRDSSDMV